MGAISKFYENSQRYSQLCVYCWCRPGVIDNGDKLFTGVDNTGDDLTVYLIFIFHIDKVFTIYSYSNIRKTALKLLGACFKFKLM
jgi:hypothetical protein